jgi:hypothetical protein
MKRNGSIIWILFLLAALFLGPTMLLRELREGGDIPTLRTIVAQESLIDAPNADPRLPAAPTLDNPQK